MLKDDTVLNVLNNMNRNRFFPLGGFSEGIFTLIMTIKTIMTIII